MSIQPRTRIGPLAALLLSVMLPHGQARAQEPNPQVKVTTNVGEFVIEVRQDRSPSPRRTSCVTCARASIPAP